jgi:hypothetical protein
MEREKRAALVRHSAAARVHLNFTTNEIVCGVSALRMKALLAR